MSAAAHNLSDELFVGKAATSLSLWKYNLLYLFLGRHVGVLPYFLPVLLIFAGRDTDRRQEAFRYPAADGQHCQPPAALQGEPVVPATPARRHVNDKDLDKKWPPPIGGGLFRA